MAESRPTRRRTPVPLAAPSEEGVRLTARFEVAATPGEVPAVRRQVRAVVTRWQLPVAAANAAVDVVHELVSNAVQHGRPPISVELHLSDAAITVYVADTELAPAKRLPYRAGVSERGLGLRLVTLLSSTWGQLSHPEGKTVWAMIRLGARHGR